MAFVMGLSVDSHIGMLKENKWEEQHTVFEKCVLQLIILLSRILHAKLKIRKYYTNTNITESSQ